jgi:hypothetical protein
MSNLRKPMDIVRNSLEGYFQVADDPQSVIESALELIEKDPRIKTLEKAKSVFRKIVQDLIAEYPHIYSRYLPPSDMLPNGSALWQIAITRLDKFWDKETGSGL